MSWDLTPLHQALKAVSADPHDSCRLLHGRGGCFAGLESLCVDWFDDLLVATLFQDPGEANLLQLNQLLVRTAEEKKLWACVQHRYQPMAPVQWLREGPGPYYARWSQLRFLLQPGNAQNLGFFLDMAPGRAWLAARAKGRRVLNLFAYTCAFSVVALAAGARSVVNVDMSSNALARGRDNHRLNQQPLDGVKFLAQNILKSWGRIKRAGPYDIVIIDPPSFQRGSFVATKDYAKVVRRLPELLPEGGEVLVCLNAPEINSDFLLTQMAQHCPEASWQGRLTPAADFPDVDIERALKLHHFNVGGHR